MTREEVKELLPIIQAFAEGKQIQDKIEGVTDWVDTDEINFEYEGQKIKHRIKPEPKYRPFKTQEECWNEMLKHQPFGWVVTKNTDAYVHICSVCGEYARQPPKVVFEYGNPCFTFEQIFSIYNFADGTPFGVKEE